jgi:hypothetical protein
MVHYVSPWLTTVIIEFSAKKKPIGLATAVREVLWVSTAFYMGSE